MVGLKDPEPVQSTSTVRKQKIFEEQPLIKTKMIVEEKAKKVEVSGFKSKSTNNQKIEEESIARKIRM